MTDSEFKELEKKGLIKAFDLKENEAFEARHNLLGIFGVLHRIDERLKQEAKKKRNERTKRDD